VSPFRHLRRYVAEPIFATIAVTSQALKPGVALRQSLARGYGKRDFVADLSAGVIVGIVALPLAMALAIASGVPPQHGLYTAIVAGGLIAALGGSRSQVSGPTAAFVVILAPISARHGIGGLLLATMMAGVLLMAMGAARLGRLVEFIPHPVTTGFTAGIALVIATLQLKDFFGLTLEGNPEHYLERVGAMARAAPGLHTPDLIIGATTLAVLVLMPRFTKRVPAPLVGLFIGAVLAAVLPHLVDGFSVATIRTRFSYESGGATHPGIPPLPPVPVLPWTLPGPNGEPLPITIGLLRELVPSAFAIAMLGAIESLLCAVVADGMARTKHDPDTELFAQGVGNVVAPFFGGIAATGAIARTATAIRAGSRSPIAAIIHAVFVLLGVVALAPLLGYLPMASLAALLLIVAWNMSEVKHFAHILRVAPKSDVTVLLVCFGLTVIFDMTISVTAGVMLAALLFMRRMAEIARTRLVDQEKSPQNGVAGLPTGALIYEIAGPLFFGAAQKAISALETVQGKAKVVILQMDGVPAMDVTGLVALESAVDHLRHDHVRVILAGVQEQPAQVLARSDLGRQSGKVTVCPTLDAAVRLAREHLSPAPSTPASP
jgi:SulP family sulfate permease